MIGHGAFGIVRLCRHKARGGGESRMWRQGTGEIRAMKQMSKKEMVYKNQARRCG